MTAQAAADAEAAEDRLDNLTAADVEFSPSGGLASTTVQDAIEEVAALSAGSGTGNSYFPSGW